MTFKDLIKFVFPMGPPEGKRFVIKSSLDINGKVFLSEQMIEEIFFDLHINLWIDIEKTEIDFNELFNLLYLKINLWICFIFILKDTYSSKEIP